MSCCVKYKAPYYCVLGLWGILQKNYKFFWPCPPVNWCSSFLLKIHHCLRLPGPLGGCSLIVLCTFAPTTWPLHLQFVCFKIVLLAPLLLFCSLIRCFVNLQNIICCASENCKSEEKFPLCPLTVCWDKLTKKRDANLLTYRRKSHSTEENHRHMITH